MCITADEMALVVKTARQSGYLVQCYDGETRARLYLLSYMTGLRKGEIASLTPRSFDLDAAQPTVTVEAAASIDPCAANEPPPPLLTQEIAGGERRAAAH